MITHVHELHQHRTTGDTYFTLQLTKHE